MVRRGVKPHGFVHIVKQKLFLLSCFENNSILFWPSMLIYNADMILIEKTVETDIVNLHLVITDQS